MDSLLIGVLGAVIDLALGVPSGISPEVIAQQTPGPSLLKLAIHLLYWPVFESSAWLATPGKRLCRLKVVDMEGNRISFGRAFLRNVAKVLSFLPLGFGFLLACLTIRSQTLHDKIARTVVLKRERNLADPADSEA